jgi:hypothetical protein
MSDETVTPAPPEYALVELLGHRRHYGQIAEVQRFGTTLICVIDVDTGQTHFYAGSALYGVTPMTKAQIDEHSASVAHWNRPRTAIAHED